MAQHATTQARNGNQQCNGNQSLGANTVVVLTTELTTDGLVAGTTTNKHVLVRAAPVGLGTLR